MNQVDNSQYMVVSGGGDFVTDSRDGCFWDEQCQRLRLMDAQQPRIHTDGTPPDGTRPLVMDDYGQLGQLSEPPTRLVYARDWTHLEAPAPVVATREISTGGEAADVSLDPVDAPAGTQFQDLHLGGDSRAALPYTDEATRHGLLVVHLARRWQRRCLLTDQPRRVWVDHLDRVWVTSHTALMLCSGGPLPQPYRKRPDRFEPLRVNPGELRQQWRQPLPAGLEVQALCADEGFLYLLVTVTASGEQRLLRRPLQNDSQALISPWELPETVPSVTDIAALERGRLALMIATAPQAPDLPVIDLLDDGTTVLLTRRYPLHSQRSGRFVAGSQTGVHYLSETGPRRLYPLPQARYRHAGSATLNTTLDAGDPDTCWHRLYLDAAIPPGCTLGLEVKVFDDYRKRGDDWHPQPPPQWQSRPSELPFYEPGHGISASEGQGLYELLLQRETGAVRQLRGRYLQVRVHMSGDGRHSPTVGAMRFYFPRLSWQEAYLPEVFRQAEVVSGKPEPANGADVRERFLAALEGMLTPVENRIANAECWLYPMVAPASALPQLARSVGMVLPPHWPRQRQRRWLQAAGELQKRKGTYAGLCLALDIATDGAVGRGQVVPVENYRLRRTLATVLGVDLSDEDHPLTLGTGQSGNSIVGESLILTEEHGREFLALLAPELALAPADADTVAAFFDRYAHRLSVLLHSDARSLRGAVETVLEQYVPATTAWHIAETEHPFILGLSPLLGIDTYLQQRPGWRQIVLNDVYLGREGIVRNPAAFAPADVIPRGDSV